MPLYGTTTPLPTPSHKKPCDRCGAYSQPGKNLYQFKHGPWAGASLCHDCRDVERPEPVSTKRVRTHCKHGHPLTDDNVIRPRGWMICVPCKKAADVAYRARKRAAA